MKKAVITISMVMITGVFGSLLSVKPPVTYTVWPSPKKSVVEAVRAQEAQEKTQAEKDADWARYVKQEEEARIQREKQAEKAQAEKVNGLVAVANRTQGPIVVDVKSAYHDSVYFTIEPGGKKVFKGDFDQNEFPRPSGGVSRYYIKAPDESLYALYVNREGYPEARKSFTTREDAKLFNVLEGSDKTLQIIETDETVKSQEEKDVKQTEARKAQEEFARYVKHEEEVQPQIQREKAQKELKKTLEQLKMQQRH